VLAYCPIDAKTVGGTRLAGSMKISLIQNTMAYKIYGKRNVRESFNCNYELNPEYREVLESHGLVVSGLSDTGRARIIELPDKQFFVATGFLPQLSSKPDKPHPLFLSYLRAVSE
jgi:CTP synthase